MPLLHYWRGDNYHRDLDVGVSYHLNQANPRLHQTNAGDSLWAFTRTLEGDYVFAAELVVRAKTQNPANFRYGRYRVWGDLRKSRYFKVEGQPRAEQTSHLKIITSWLRQPGICPSSRVPAYCLKRD